MILGRPTNLVLGAVTAIFNVVVLISNSQGGTFFTPEITAAINIALGAVILAIANQPPTVNVGDTVNVATPSGTPNIPTVVAAPPPPSPTGGPT